MGVETVFLPLFVKKLPGKFEKYHRLFRNFHVWLRDQWFLIKKPYPFSLSYATELLAVKLAATPMKPFSLAPVIAT